MKKRSTTKKTSTAAASKGSRRAGTAFLVSVHGPYGSRALVELSTEAAAHIFGGTFAAAPSPSGVIDAVRQQLAQLRKQDEEVADSALAASAIALAYEIENPANSATSKSMCARELRETMSQLRELVPPKPTKDGIHELSESRVTRRRVAAAPPRKRS